MLACGEQIRPVCMMASSMKQESRGFSHVRFNPFLCSEKNIMPKLYCMIENQDTISSSQNIEIYDDWREYECRFV